MKLIRDSGIATALAVILIGAGYISDVSGAFNAIAPILKPACACVVPYWPYVLSMLIFAVSIFVIAYKMRSSQKRALRARIAVTDHFQFISVIFARIRTVTLGTDFQFKTYFCEYLDSIDRSMDEMVGLINKSLLQLVIPKRKRIDALGIHLCCARSGFFYEYFGDAGRFSSLLYNARASRGKNKGQHPPIITFLNKTDGGHVVSSLVLFISRENKDLNPRRIPENFFGISIKNSDSTLSALVDLKKDAVREEVAKDENHNIRIFPPKYWSYKYSEIELKESLRLVCGGSKIPQIPNVHKFVTVGGFFISYAQVSEFLGTSLFTLIKSGEDSTEKRTFNDRLLLNISNGLGSMALGMLRGDSSIKHMYIYYKVLNVDNADAAAAYVIAQEALDERSIDEVFSLIFATSLNLTHENHNNFDLCPSPNKSETLEKYYREHMIPEAGSSN